MPIRINELGRKMLGKLDISQDLPLQSSSSNINCCFFINLVARLREASNQVQVLDKRYWAVVSGQTDKPEIGGKAQALRDATPDALKAGFVLPHRTVAAMDVFKSPQHWEYAQRVLSEGADFDTLMNALLSKDDFWRRRSIVDIEKFERETVFTPDDERTIAQLLKMFQTGVPLVVRSSAHGDACGNGNFASRFVWVNDPEEQQRQFKLAVMGVLLSQYKKSALAYRADLGLPEGMAVMFEPVFGGQWKSDYEELENELYFGPAFGGYAISGTRDIEPFAVVAPGLPTKAVNFHGARIEPDRKGDLIDLLYNLRLRTPSAKDDISVVGDLLVLGDRSLFASTDSRVSKVDHSDSICPEANSDHIFTKLARFAELRGVRQYVEFGLDYLKRRWQLALLQCADHKQNEDCHYFQGGKILAEGTSVENGGDKICNGILIVRGENALPAIREMNSLHPGYLILMYTTTLSKLTKLSGWWGKLDYASINNANAFLESGGHNGHESLGGHLGGGPKEKGMILGGDRSLIEVLETALETAHGIPSNADSDTPYQFYDVKVRVRASVREQRVTIEKVE
jgi:hypothetical protein